MIQIESLISILAAIISLLVAIFKILSLMQDTQNSVIDRLVTYNEKSYDLWGKFFDREKGNKLT